MTFYLPFCTFKFIQMYSNKPLLRLIACFLSQSQATHYYVLKCIYLSCVALILCQWKSWFLFSPKNTYSNNIEFSVNTKYSMTYDALNLCYDLIFDSDMRTPNPQPTLTHAHPPPPTPPLSHYSISRFHIPLLLSRILQHVSSMYYLFLCRVTPAVLSPAMFLTVGT